MHTHDYHHSHEEMAPITRGRTIRWARHYDSFVTLLTLGRIAALREETLRQIELAPGASVLEVGCGTGSLALLAKAHVSSGSVYGIDPAPEMITVARAKAAQQKLDVDFRLGVIEALPFPEHSFEVVLSSAMFHHLPEDLKVQGLAEIYRVLKPGGQVLIVDIKRPTSLIQRLSPAAISHHGMTSGVQDLLPLLMAAGFRDLQQGNMQWKPLGFVQGSRGNE